MTSERFEVSSSTGTEVAAVLALVSYLISTGVNATSLFAPLVFAAVIIIFSQGRGWLTAALESTPVQALGRWSYSIYLVHALLYYGLRLALVMVEKITKWPLTASGAGNERIFTFGGTAIDLAVIAVLLAVTIVISSKTYRFIEKPFMVAGSKKATGEGATQPAMA